MELRRTESTTHVTTQTTREYTQDLEEGAVTRLLDICEAQNTALQSKCETASCDTQIVIRTADESGEQRASVVAECSRQSDYTECLMRANIKHIKQFIQPVFVELKKQT